MTYPPLKGEGKFAKRAGEGVNAQRCDLTPTRRPSAAGLPFQGEGNQIAMHVPQTRGERPP